MSLRKQYETDSTKEIEGVEFPVGINDDGSECVFLIARMVKSNTAYTASLERHTKPVQGLIDRKSLGKAKGDALMQDVFCDVILKGWQNVPLADVTGKETDKGYAEFNAVNAKALFKALPDLYDQAYAFSQNAENYKKAQLESDSKN